MIRGPEVVACMAGALGLEKVTPQRGWEALRAIGWTIQVPRPRPPQGATAEEREALKKTRRGGRGGSRAPPGDRYARWCAGHSALKPASSG